MIFSLKSELTQVWSPHPQLTTDNGNQDAIISTSLGNKFFKNSWYKKLCLKKFATSTTHCH